MLDLIGLRIVIADLRTAFGRRYRPEEERRKAKRRLLLLLIFGVAVAVWFSVYFTYNPPSLPPRRKP